MLLALSRYRPFTISGRNAGIALAKILLKISAENQQFKEVR